MTARRRAISNQHRTEARNQHRTEARNFGRTGGRIRPNVCGIGRNIGPSLKNRCLKGLKLGMIALM
jgi:hypothetical protein